MTPKKPLCLVCKKPCEDDDRNTDGTYAHRDCLYATMTPTSIVRKPR